VTGMTRAMRLGINYYVGVSEHKDG
jgi:hypothetical protein